MLANSELSTGLLIAFVVVAEDGEEEVGDSGANVGPEGFDWLVLVLIDKGCCCFGSCFCRGCPVPTIGGGGGGGGGGIVEGGAIEWLVSVSRTTSS